MITLNPEYMAIQPILAFCNSAMIWEGITRNPQTVRIDSTCSGTMMIHISHKEELWDSLGSHNADLAILLMHEFPVTR